MVCRQRQRRPTAHDGGLEQVRTAASVRQKDGPEAGLGEYGRNQHVKCVRAPVLRVALAGGTG